MDWTSRRESHLKTEVEDVQRLYGNELETFFREKALSKHDFQPDYTSEEAYLASVSERRKSWGRILGEFDPLPEPGPIERILLHDDETFAAWLLRFEFLPGVVSRAVLALPKSNAEKLPLVVCQHGISCSTYNMFGLLDEAGLYKAYGLELVKAGFAVLAPVNKTGGPARNRLERMAHLVGKTLFGLERAKLSRWLDVLGDVEARLDMQRVGMSGLSLGGCATLLFTPLEPRFRAACIIAWFNHRQRKMVVDDPRHSCFVSTEEEHAFIPGWLPGFTDADLVGLICPRPLMIQQGKADGIAWWPWVLEEYERAREHYVKLGCPDRIEMVMEEVGHAAVPAPLVRFFRRWLMDE